MADETVSSVPAEDEDMLLALAAGRAVLLTMHDATREEFELRGGQPAREAMAEFGAVWKAGVRVKMGRLRAGRLVAP